MTKAEISKKALESDDLRRHTPQVHKFMLVNVLSGQQRCRGAFLTLLLTLILAPGIAESSDVVLMGMEVTQAIQSSDYSNPWNVSTNNTVSLIANKKTVVRAYFNTIPSPAGAVWEITGSLSEGGPGGKFIVNSDNSLQAKNITGFQPSSRASIFDSLNFTLPDKLTSPNSILTLKVAISGVGIGGAPITCSNCAGTLVTVKFVQSPPLRLRLVRLKYTSCANGAHYEPREIDVALIKSWLLRAFPISKLEVIEGGPVNMLDQDFFPSTFTEENTNTQLAAIRGDETSCDASNPDCEPSVDPRFRYMSIVFDSDQDDVVAAMSSANTCACAVGRACSTNNITQTGMEFRGAAHGSDPILFNRVASSPVGPPSFHPVLNLDTTWDKDASYGDWYTGHELAHLFGLKHLDFCNAPGPYDLSFVPFPMGQLSGADEKFFGFDVGDSITLSGGAITKISQNSLRGTQQHDLMTYCDYIWVGDHLYQQVLSQLNIENPPPPPPAIPTGLRVTQSDNLRAEQASLINQNEDSMQQARTISVHHLHATRKLGIGEERTAVSLRVVDTTAHPLLQSGDFLSVIGTVNLTRKTGAIRFTSHVSRATIRTEDPRSPVLIRILRDTTPKSKDYPVLVNRASDGNGGDETGLIDAIIPIPQDGHINEVKLILINGGQERELDSRLISRTGPHFVGDIDILPNLTLGITESTSLSLSWKVEHPESAIEQLTYTVRIRSDVERKWQTWAVGSPSPKFTIAPEQITTFRSTGARELEIKVIASDGFNTDEKTAHFRLQ